jgi:putative hydrolase of the HAD superfamily
LGAVKTQKRKVELLGFTPYFERIFYSDVSSDKNKHRAFKEILDHHPGTPPDHFLAVGNRIDSEIREAKELGMQTVLMEHGEYVHLKPDDKFEEPDARITRLSQLKELLE